MDRWAIVGFLAAALTLAACIWAGFGTLPGGKPTLAAIAAAWAILPPAWFWWEYFYVFRTQRSNEGTWEYFKHGQQLGVAVWAGIAASVAAFTISPLSDSNTSHPKLDCKVMSITAAASAPTTSSSAFELRLSCGT